MYRVRLMWQKAHLHARQNGKQVLQRIDNLGRFNAINRLYVYHVNFAGILIILICFWKIHQVKSPLRLSKLKKITLLFYLKLHILVPFTPENCNTGLLCKEKNNRK